MRKIAGLCVVGIAAAVAVAVAAVAIWAKSVSFSTEARAVPEATTNISPHELHLQIDLKSLPAQQIADPI